MRPSTVIFDMDDVLCRYDLGRRLRALARITGQMPRDRVTAEDLLALIATQNKKDASP